MATSYDIHTPAQAWDYFVGSQTVAEWLEFDGPTTPEAIAVYLASSEETDFFASDDISERDRIAQLLARYIAQESS